MEIIYILDLIGTFAFAVSGALVASNKDFDLFGVLIIAFVTAVGGGMLRDIMINAHPINWIGDLNYVYVILVAVIFTFLFKSKIDPLRKTMFLFDTIGISVFTLLGLQKGLTFQLPFIVALLMGMVSAVFGGVIRDVLTNKIPLIFHKEIYASACLIGGLMYLVVRNFIQIEWVCFVLGTLTIISIRIVAVRFHLELPKIKEDLFGKTKS